VNEMYSSVNASGVIGAATGYAGSVDDVVVIVVALSVTLILAGWIVAKFRARRAPAKRKAAAAKRRKVAPRKRKKTR